MPDSLYQRVLQLGDRYTPTFMHSLFPQFYDAREMHTAGEKALRDKDFKLAATFFSRATRLAPDNPNGWAMYGRALFALDRKVEALNAFLVEEQLRPDGAAASYDLAQVLSSEGRFEEALEYAKKATELKGYSTESWLSMVCYIGRQAIKFNRQEVREEVMGVLRERFPLIGHTDIFVRGFSRDAVATAILFNR